MLPTKNLLRRSRRMRPVAFDKDSPARTEVVPPTEGAHSGAAASVYSVEAAEKLEQQSA